MRILHVIPFFSPEMGGSAHVAYQLCRRLAQRGHQVTVVASDYATERCQFDSAGFEVVLLPSLISRWGFYVTPGLWAWAQQHVRDFDLIHMHTLRTFQNAVVHRFAVRYAVPYVLSAHGTLPVMMQRQFPKRIYDLLAGRAVLASASGFIAVSPVEVEQYRRAGLPADRITVIYNGLDLDEFARLPARGTFRNNHGIADEAQVVLFLGRLDPIKGIGYLIEAFARVQARLAAAVLVIAGPDEGERPRLETLAGNLGLRDRVCFAGPLYGRDKLAAYVDADVLASPGGYEIFGLVPLEALLCGIPVVVAAETVPATLLGQAAYVVPHGDIEALSEALQRALTDGDDVSRRVQAGQAAIRQRLDWDVLVSDAERLYAEMADLGGRRPDG